MDIKVIASGSSGNAYLIDDGYGTLLLDAGVPIKQIQAATGFMVSQLSGVLLSHEHGDHSKAAKDLMKLGVNVYSSRGTYEKLRLSGHRAKVLESGRSYLVGDKWAVIPFDTIHDCAQPFGYIVISVATGEKVLFVTDSMYLDTVYNGLDYMIIETNYSEEAIKESVEQGVISPELMKRIMKSHMSLETVQEYLANCDLSQCKEIYLAHLSSDNSRADEFKEAIQRQTGVIVHIC